MSETISESRSSGRSGSAQQIARIAALLTEIEQLSDGARDMPLPLLVKTRTSIERARSILQHCRKSANVAIRQEVGDGTPQPEVDGDVMERMYRRLEVGPLPTDR